MSSNLNKRYVIAYILLAFVLCVGLMTPIDYVLFMPGKAYSLGEMITVPEGHSSDGSFLMTVVMSRQATIPLYIRGVLDPSIDLFPLAEVRPTFSDGREYEQVMLQSMLSSQEIASGLALRLCGYEVSENGDGVQIVSFSEINNAEGILALGDIIIACDGKTVHVNAELGEILRRKEPGETAKITVMRGESKEELDFDIELVRRIDDPAIAAIGISVVNAGWHLDLPVEIIVSSEDIGGSSAGLMMTLEIINQLSVEELTHGKKIAGTGTIDLSGRVGIVSGVRQKVMGAVASEAAYFLVPLANFQEAYDQADGKMTVVAIDNIEDALAFLGGLR